FILKPEWLPNYTYDDYCQWEGNWELIAGIPYSFPSPPIDHQIITGNIFALISTALDLHKNLKANIPVDWKIDEHTVVRPDISVIAKPVTNDYYLTFAPTLIFEVISPSSVVRDKNIKFDLYKNEKVKYYVLVDVQGETVEVFELKSGEYISVLQTRDQ